MEKELMSLALLLFLVGSFMFDTKVSISPAHDKHNLTGKMEEKSKTHAKLDSTSLIRDVLRPAKPKNIAVSYINHASQTIKVRYV